MVNIFQVIITTGHWISNLNPAIGRGHEIIIVFGGLHEPKHRYWRVMTTQSCNFDKSQHRQLRMAMLMKLDSRYTSWKRIHWALLISYW